MTQALIRKLKQLARPLQATPLHPQWLAGTDAAYLLRQIKNIPAGSVVIDVGCANKWPRSQIDSSCHYIGFDLYETATNWYHTKPDVFGDASVIPFASNSMDVALLLDVLEHVPDTNRVLSEIHRALKKSGILIVKMPFLYPLHDEPRDYVRLTTHGFRCAAESLGYSVTSEHPQGSPIVTAALLMNIALARTVVVCAANKNPLCVPLVLLAPLIFLGANLFAKLLSLMTPPDSTMSFSNVVIMRKN
ncbi:MAG: class I SAM-dependent methyltransferase [Pseudomonadota bacterium]|mgnify:CR=1 FL=1